MGHLTAETFVMAPRARLFDLARDVGSHLRSASFSGERVVAPGRMSGLLERGDRATFEGRHFGIRQRFTLEIVEMNVPSHYVDELVRSAFRSMRHLHEFEERDGGTLMRDTLDWVSPFGILGTLADALFVERGLRRFVTRKQAALKALAEGRRLEILRPRGGR